ncbi:pilus assembly protein PilZ [Pseudothauera nasutitermitis]|uniref:Pilus assembly protein PilZ n=1 Tax=Pseudothauera nasutitermitis TaxID=2565930 RepID=A0A4S4B4M8_9RHOO|nr:CpaD family pilus assembly lipoprotein [Pseudothauera nasutitermitis]THF67251.1 pilus assembly protein PilZ [Pseudothauera nasutitermitis]
MTKTLPRHRPANLALAILPLMLLLAACETPIHAMRASRFPQTVAEAPTVEPRALALALQVSADGQGLTPESLRQANAMLGSQGRLHAQRLSITPFNARGEAFAQRLASALAASGANAPQVLAIPADAERLEVAQRQRWDLELQSEALAVITPDCSVAKPQDWMVHPYRGVGPLGCANRANIARMVSDPRDLTRPRTLEGADGSAAALAVERYQTGELRDLIDINFDNDD